MPTHSDNRLLAAFNKPATLEEQLDSIINASPAAAVTRIQYVSANKDGYGPDQVLLILEDSLTREVRKNPQRRSVIQALKRAIKKAGPPISNNQSPISNPQSPISTVEVISEKEGKQVDLAAHARRINETIELIKGHENAFEDATLEHRLCIGLEIAAAQEAFGMTYAEAGKLGGEAKASVSTVDTLAAKPPAMTSNPLGFSNWIKKEIPDLKRPTAIRYASGFHALGIPRAEATPARIKAKLKDLYHHADKSNIPRPSLASLVKQAPKPPKPEITTIIVPKSSKQLKLEDARETYHGWMETWDKALKHGHLESLDRKGLLQLQDFTATVRDRIKARLK